MFYITTQLLNDYFLDYIIENNNWKKREATSTVEASFYFSLSSTGITNKASIWLPKLLFHNTTCRVKRLNGVHPGV